MYAGIHCGDCSEADLGIVDKEKELMIVPTLSNPNVLLFNVQNSLLYQRMHLLNSIKIKRGEGDT